MRLALMRPRDKLEESITQAEAQGFEVIAASPLRIEINDGSDLDGFLSELEEGRADVVVLTSTTGVDALVELLARKGRSDPRGLFAPCVRIAIGPLTANAMASVGMPADLVPDEHSSEGLVRSFKETLAGKRVFLLRSSHGEKVLFDGLAEAGCMVKEVVLYNLVPQPDSPEMTELARESLSGKVDAFAFTSALSAATFIEAAERFATRDEVVAVLNSRLVAAMGGPTRRKLEQMGIRVGVVPSQATFGEMLKELRLRE